MTILAVALQAISDRVSPVGSKITCNPHVQVEIYISKWIWYQNDKLAQTKINPAWLMDTIKELEKERAKRMVSQIATQWIDDQRRSRKSHNDNGTNMAQSIQ